MRVGDGIRDGRLDVGVEQKIARLEPQQAGAGAGAEPKGRDEEPSPFAKILHGLGREVDRGEAVMRRAVKGGDLDNGDLLALQAGVYRYSEAVDLSAKLIERTSSGVKTVLQGQ